MQRGVAPQRELRRDATVVDGVALEIARRVHELLGERHVLELDEQPLPVRAEEGEVVLHGAQVVAIFLRLELAPGVLHLRALDCRGVEERAVGDPLAVAIDEDVVARLADGDAGGVGAAAPLPLRFAPSRRDRQGGDEQQDRKPEISLPVLPRDQEVEGAVEE